MKEILLSFLKGARRAAVFALTSRCNCKCLMCEMHKQPPNSISLEDAKKILDFLSQNDFLIVYLTGGEPTLHPHLSNIVKYASDLGLVVTTTTNGTVNTETISSLKKSGLYVLGVSLDHWNAEICEQIRQYKDIKTKQTESIEYAKKIGLRTYALTFLNPYVVHDGIEKLINYTNQSLEVPFGFCYPTKSSINTYQLGGIVSDMECHDELRNSVQTILSMKMNGGKIATLSTYIEDVLRYNDGLEPNVYCKGGEDVVYIDWFGDVYPCFLKGKLFNIINEEPPSFLKDVKCNDCLINCFREPSILSQLSPSILLKEAVYTSRVWNLFL